MRKLGKIAFMTIACYMWGATLHSYMWPADITVLAGMTLAILGISVAYWK